MKTKNHSVFHLIALFGGMFIGMLAGFYVGAWAATSFSGDHKWLAIVGVVIGIITGVGGCGWIVRRLIPANCRSCGCRTRCKLNAFGGDTVYTAYSCPACGETECPGRDSWHRVLNNVVNPK